MHRRILSLNFLVLHVEFYAISVESELNTYCASTKYENVKIFDNLNLILHEENMILEISFLFVSCDLSSTTHLQICYKIG